MAEKQSSDLFMIFCENNDPIAGESQVQLAIAGKPPNELITGFAPNYMFEITEFSFGLGGGRASPLEKHLTKISQNTGEKFDPKILAKSLGNQDDGTDPTAVSEIEFSRLMDTASATLLSHMIKRTYFKKVAIVKRKAAGGPAGGEAFMRVDFRGVVLVESSWSNGEPIKEDYTFQSRATTMRYRPQLEDGSLGDTIVGFKTLAPGQTEAPL